MSKRTNIIVGCIYRCPDIFVDNFNAIILNSLLQKLSKESSKSIFLHGDFNIDFPKFNSCNFLQKVCNFFDELSSSNFIPETFLPSWITRSTKMLIYNIFCKSHNLLNKTFQQS